MRLIRRISGFLWLTGALILTHLIARSIFPENNVAVDLLLFNSIGVMASVIAFNAPLHTDRISANSFGAAALVWSMGSFFSTWNSFFELQIPAAISDICYAIFYPLVFIAITRSFTQKRSMSALEVLDTVIIAVGLTSVLTAFVLKPAMVGLDGSAWQVFISILYPVGDIVLLSMVLVYLLLNPLSRRSIFLGLGLLSFATSDLFFIWGSLSATYEFGAITDDGWIIGLVLLSTSLLFSSPENKTSEKVSSYGATVALIASGCLLGVAALKPGYFPSFILIPGFITIALAFIRMSFALQEANTASNERVLARTDELTGSGYIFLLDLDGFKEINDNRGHAAGDELLKQVANRFSRVTPAGGQLARLGGDEFGLLAKVDQQEATELAQALLATLSYPISLLTGQVRVKVSIGYAPIDQNIDSVDCLRRADLAMYEAKRSGSGQRIWDGHIENIG